MRGTSTRVLLPGPFCQMKVSPVKEPEGAGSAKAPPPKMLLLVLLPPTTMDPLATVRVPFELTLMATAEALSLMRRAPMVALAGAVMAYAAEPDARIRMMSLGVFTVKLPAA